MVTSARDVVHPLSRRGRSRASKDENPDKTVSICKDFGLYQICLLLATQLSYIPVTASMLSASFLKMSEDGCVAMCAAAATAAMTASDPPIDNSTLPSATTVDHVTCAMDKSMEPIVAPGEFHSILVDWRIACTADMAGITTTFSTVIMVGGFIGSVTTGFLADRFGRKPVVIGSLILLSLCNAALLGVGHLPFWAAFPVYLLLGASAGGYMTTNLVLVVESLCSPSSRLLVVALNGWSLAMVATAGIAYLLPYWFHFHLAVSIIALVCAVALYFIADESLRWLKSSMRVDRFDASSARLTRFNRRKNNNDVVLLVQLEKESSTSAASTALLQQQEMGNGVESSRPPSASSGPPKTPSYLDLLAEKTLRPRLLSLAYCFLVSSIVSFGLYFGVDSLSGNRYLNMAVMGMAKFCLGLLPFIVSSCLSRKKVSLISVGITATAAWAIVVCICVGLKTSHVSLTALSILITAALDPTWKIAHLYSTELFPTTMRNMARGLCQAAARTGSVLAPVIAHLRHGSYPYLSFGLYAVLLTGQFVITAIFMPKEVSSNLMDRLPVVEITEPKRRRDIVDDDARSSEELSQLSETVPLTP